jgi:Tol biopolymer transport system component
VSKNGEMAVLSGAEEVGGSGTLARVPFSGGTPREVLEDVVAADWGPDGESIAVSRSVEGRKRLEYPIGNVLVEAEGRPPLHLRVSPAGDRVAYFDYDIEAGDYSVSVVGSDRSKQVLSRGWRAVAGLSWSPSGGELWFSGVRSSEDPGLYAVDLSGKQRVLTHTPGWVTLLDVNGASEALVTSTHSRIGILCASPGRELRDLAWLDASVLYQISDDAGSLLFVELAYSEGRNPAIYLRRTDGSPAVKLGFGNRPALSRDGKWVACIRREASGSQLYLLPTGAGEARTLPSDGIRYETVEWLPDVSGVLFTGSEPGRPVRSFRRDTKGGPVKPVTDEGVRASRVSPDGRQVVIITAGKIWLRDLDGGTPRAVAEATPTDSVIRWSGDGRSLFVRRDLPENGAARILRLNTASGASELVREIKPPEPGAHLYGAITLSADGKSYAYSYQRDLAILYLVRGLR